ncbi:PhzF family phenazine biosynthesis protein [Roseovarius aestuariivivens]|uniref:PhzF family phenazine biosynthesis protein n=1 Tax=Roseovarius aestuariivivens TaxID=1888910 RepID=UPI001081CE06|nr:PhzF family phenazine biosynthesis protein [Roseovarius aestuariivivens]
MLNFVTYDVFTDTPYQGNPLAIVLDAADLTTAQMQSIAREMNLSETIFVMLPENPAHTAKVRIFFPTAEIPFAGHPTIGCAIHLSGLLDASRAAAGDTTMDMVLEEAAGPVPVTVTKTGACVSACFTAPVLPQCRPVDIDMGLTAAGLGLEMHDIGNAVCPAAEVWQAGPDYILVPLASLSALERAWPSGADWASLTGRAECISAWCFVPDGQGGFRARMFSPAGGTPEDPATGSAVVTFAGLLAHHGRCGAAQTQIDIHQGVEMGRPSRIRALISTDSAKVTRVRIEGAAVPISSGRLRRP